MKQNYINHIAFVLDKSASMGRLANDVVRVFENQIKYLAQRSQELDQETRVSVYLFNDTVECLVYDKDVLRLPSIKEDYRTSGMTALIDATAKSISDLSVTPELYGDHSFLIYVVTDGQNNINNDKYRQLKQRIEKLPDNWTVGVLVPDQDGVREAKMFGFPAQNIQVWTTDSRGLKEAGENIQKATEGFLRSRSLGVRGTKSLFSVDLSGVSPSVVKTNLDVLNPNDYMLLPVHKEAVIKPFVESWTQAPYRVGSAYYQLVKPEKIQNYKQVCIKDRANGKVYGGAQARKLLNLPDYEVKVSPGDFGAYDVFISSTSANRKLPSGTQLLVIK